MSDEGGSVTLVFYRIGSGSDIFREPFLNLVAAAFQMSTFTHVELAIGTRNIQYDTQYTNEFLLLVTGNEAGAMGQMSNVCRIFNDDVGVSA